MMSFHDYLGLSNACSYDIDDVIGRVDRFGFKNFCSPVLTYRITSGFMFATLACATAIQNFICLYLIYFLIKISSVGMRFLSLNKRNNLLPNLFDFAAIFRFARLPLILHVQIREKPILKIFGDGMWEKESITDVQWQQENPNPRVNRSSGKLGKPRFLLEQWTLRLGFSCLHWTPMMDSIYLYIEPRFEKTCLWGLRPVKTLTDRISWWD